MKDFEVIAKISRDQLRSVSASAKGLGRGLTGCQQVPHGYACCIPSLCFLLGNTREMEIEKIKEVGIVKIIC